jgi:hypothetical protein
MAEVFGRPFVHVTSENRDRKGTGENLRGAEIAICKIAGLRLPRFESWSCHTPSDLRKRGCCRASHAPGAGQISLRFTSARRGADADRASVVSVRGRIAALKPGTSGAR